MKKYTVDEQLAIIKRGAVEIISEAELRKKLEYSVSKNKPLHIKAGFDPTAPDLHLGHTVLLRKLRQFQDLGHKVYFLIGDFTGRIGDPTGRNELRKQLTKEEVEKNAATYKKQVSKVLDMDKLQVVFNGEWFDKMNGLEFANLLTHYTATRMLERDDFTKRREEKKAIYMSEFIYPILQGYDSVELKADLEIGGTDQIFNLLVGRDLQKDFNQPQQVVLTMPLLEGTDGVQKMSKSYNNYVGINEDAQTMFGKIMSVSDEMMLKYYTLLTDENLDEIRGIHPKEAKLRLAQNITAQYHGSKAALAAREEFERVFSGNQIPQDIEQYRIKPGKNKLIEVLIDAKLAPSKNEARRLILQNAVTLDDQILNSDSAVIEKCGILKVGKRRFLKIEL